MGLRDVEDRHVENLLQLRGLFDLGRPQLGEVDQQRLAGDLRKDPPAGASASAAPYMMDSVQGKVFVSEIGRL